MNLVDALDLRLPTMISAVGGGGKTTLLFSLGRALRRQGRSVFVTTSTAIFHPAQVGLFYDQLLIGAIPADAWRPPQRAGRLVVGARDHHRYPGKLRGYVPEDLDGLQAKGLFDAILVEADGARHRPVKAPAAHEPVMPSRSDAVIGVIGLDCLSKPLTPDHVHRPEQFAALTGLAPGAPITPESLVRLASAPLGLFKGAGPSARQILLLNKADTTDRVRQGKALAEMLLPAAGKVERVLIASLTHGAGVKAVVS